MYVCMSVCLSLSVCLLDDNFRKPCCRKFIFAHAAYLHRLRVKFVYEGHRVRVKFKVTAAKKVKKNSYSYSPNVKQNLIAITLVVSNMEP